jgi:hypothetical protein
MKKFTCRFRSIMVNNVEKNVPGTSRTTIELDMDEKSIEEHMLELTVKEIVYDRSWKINLLLSVMVAGGIAAMIFGIVYVTSGKSMGEAQWTFFVRVFVSVSLSILILLWIFLSVKNSISNKKREYVEKIRGKGNWKIVDESEWENFYRLLMISKKRSNNGY